MKTKKIPKNLFLEGIAISLESQIQKIAGKEKARPQHTPTPWHVEHTDDDYIRINNENGDLPVEDSGYGKHPLIVSTADAAFIVKACNAHEELIAACMAARSLLLRTTLQDRKDTAVCKQLSDALAKAEGEQL